MFRCIDSVYVMDIRLLKNFRELNTRLSITLFCFLNTIWVTGQEINCNKANVSLMPSIAAGDSVMHLHVSMDIQTNTIADTLVLETSVKIGDKDIDSGVSMAPYNLVVTDFYNVRDTIEANVRNISGAIPFCDRQEIRIIKGCHSRFYLDYDVIGTGLFFSLLKSNGTNIYEYSKELESVFPNNVNIKARDIKAPDEYYVIRSHDEGMDRNMDELLFVNKNYVALDSFMSSGTKVRLYSILTEPSSKANQIKNELRRAFRKLYKLSPFKKDFTILRVFYRAGGVGAGHSINDICIVDIDLNSISVFHECLHSIFENDFASQKKGQFFVSESIIEWLSRYFTGKENTTKWKKTCDTPIYDLEEDDSNTACQIYERGPEIIDDVARMVGADKLALCLIDFLDSSRGKVVDYDMLIEYLNTHISRRAVALMDRAVKGI